MNLPHTLMPTCSAAPLRSQSLKICLREARCIPGHSKLAGQRLPKSRLASTAAALAPKPQPDGPSHSPRTCQTTIHHTTAFLRRVLPSRSRDGIRETESLEFWEEMLSRAQDGLSVPKSVQGAARVVVYSVDDYSGARLLVNALLEEPFGPDAAKVRVRERWKAAGDSSSLLLRYGRVSKDIDNAVSVRSSWLQQFPVPVEIQELSQNQPSSSSAATVLPSHITPLFSADIPIIVCNPLTTPLADLLADPSIPWAHSNTILIVTYSSTAPIPPSLLQRIRNSVPESLTVLFVDPARALAALEVLSADPKSASSVQRYQDGFSESRVSEVSAVISQKLSALQGTTTLNGDSVLPALRKQNALDLVADSIAACRRAVNAVELECNGVRRGVSSLQGQMEEFRAKIGVDVLGAEEKPEVKDALERARVGVRETMDRLTAWRMVWKVDDIADTVNASVSRSWCRDLENKLIFETGRLSVTQNFLSGAANSVVSSFPKTSSFHSPVLQNTLAQHRTSPTYAVSPTSLTAPIHIRRVQLTYPTSTLQQTAQRAVLGMGGSVLGGIGIAWAGWADQMGLLGMFGLGLEAETAAGLGLFSAVAGVWYSIGRWDKAKKRWWRDWDRVGEGLERDLRVGYFCFWYLEV
ncbi:hypothetical protein EIP91_003945 [Steccherinum ochraceum]|uniref:Mmc1 C-terminal domain-containing protein n=1 Tax=Steccherinum ochraceum TaxID=92696 RepID=A0A4R0RR98_9APHY|nr:hypothetical protein EIP91_003945 [Steccherinum ochraceum]